MAAGPCGGQAGAGVQGVQESGGVGVDEVFGVVQKDAGGSSCRGVGSGVAADVGVGRVPVVSSCGGGGGDEGCEGAGDGRMVVALAAGAAQVFGHGLSGRGGRRMPVRGGGFDDVGAGVLVEPVQVILGAGQARQGFGERAPERGPGQACALGIGKRA